MVRVRAFSALRPRPELVRDVASVPYDVVSTEEARLLASRSPESFLRVVRAEVDLPAGTDPYAPAVYEAARARLEDLQRRRVLIREEAPSIYLYRQEMQLGDRALRQTGVVACCAAEDYEQGVIKRHELTRAEKEDDRTRHVLATRAHTGPVFLLHRDDAQLSAQVEADTRLPPLYDFEADDGVRHTLWRAPNPGVYAAAFAQHDAAYVADGHHRAASAARVARTLAADNPRHTGDEEYAWLLAALFPASSLTVLPYHRVVTGLGAHDAASFLSALGGVGALEGVPLPRPPPAGSVGVYVAGAWYRLTLPPVAPGVGAADALDAARLTELVLRPLLGIDDVRRDPRVDFVGGVRGLEALEKRVQAGEASVAFALAATDVRALMAVADAGDIMPPKSTWFEPKLRSGLLVHTLD